MTEREQLVTMLARAGIEHVVDKNRKGHTTVVVERGYSGFVTEFEFNDLGHLVDMGAYE
jgi:hypothetical protein